MAEQTNLTVGSVRRQLTTYALPIVATSVMQAVYAMVDLLVVGWAMGEAGASGVSNGSMAMNFVTQVAIGLATGGNVLVSQYFGAGDREKRETVCGTFFTLFLLGGVLSAALCFAFSGGIVTLLCAPAWSETYDYLRITSLGLVFVFLYNCLGSILRGVGNSRVPMAAVGCSTALNIGLDLLLVAGLDLGTGGAALATVIAQGVCCLVVLGYLLKHRDIYSFRRETLRLRVRPVKQILKLGFPCAVQMTVAGLSWMTVLVLVNGYGVVCSAAMAYANKIKEFCQMFPAAFSNAAAVMIAQCLGAGKFDRAKAVLREGMKLSLLLAAGMVLVVEGGAPLLVRMFTDEAPVAAIAVLDLRIEILGQLAYAVFLTYHALMVGAGHTYMVLISSFVNCILFRVVLAVSLNALLGMAGIFIACAVAPLSSVPIGWAYTRSNRWRRSMALGKKESI